MTWVSISSDSPRLELPKDITGGPWYFEQEFDTVFVDVVSQFVQKILAEEVVIRAPSHLQESGLDVGAILQKITLSSISNVHILSPRGVLFP